MVLRFQFAAIKLIAVLTGIIDPCICDIPSARWVEAVPECSGPDGPVASPVGEEGDKWMCCILCFLTLCVFWLSEAGRETTE